MLNLSCPINKLSYGYVSTNILRELYRLDNKISLFPIGRVEYEKEDEQVVLSSLQNSHLWNKYTPSLKIFHQNLLAEHPISSKKIGFPIFELDQFNKIEKHHLSSQDEIFVCSQWAKDIVLNNNIGVDVKVIPLGVNKEIFHYKENKINRGKVVFLNIGKWEKRKGHDLLARAFYEVFNKVDDVELWMVPKNYFISPELENKWVDYYKSNLGNKVKIIGPLDNAKQIAEIIQKSDVGLFPFRSEGHCLPLLEMLSCGKRVVTTNYSGPTEYLNKDNSVTIDPDGLEYALDDVFFFGDGSWAKLGESYYRAFCEALWAEYELAKKNGKQVNNFGLITSGEYSWKNTAQKIKANI